MATVASADFASAAAAVEADIAIMEEADAETGTCNDSLSSSTDDDDAEEEEEEEEGACFAFFAFCSLAACCLATAAVAAETAKEILSLLNRCCFGNCGVTRIVLLDDQSKVSTTGRSVPIISLTSSSV